MNTTSRAELRLTFSNSRLMVRDDNTERVAVDTQMVFSLSIYTKVIKSFLPTFSSTPVTGCFNEDVEKPESDHPIEIGQSFFEHPMQWCGFFTIANVRLALNALNAVWDGQYGVFFRVWLHHFRLHAAYP